MFFIFVLFIVLLTGCAKTTYIRSRPVGYGVVSYDFVAKGSFLYDSQTPFNLNEVSLTVYSLPHIWAEIKENQAAILSLDELNFIVFDEQVYSSVTRRAFAKYIIIDQTIWTGHQEGIDIIYRNSENLSLHDFLNDEENIKIYIDAIESGQVYMLDHEFVTLFGYDSKYDEGNTPFQLNHLSSMVQINYVTTRDSMPQLSDLFPDYNQEDLDILFERAYSKRNKPEYKTMEYIKE